ncbi:hypothetical protein KM043_003951 [Ampulex compressa]|nr:hypothetical protein KM043_003951 [Ampulex compressa]
MGRSSLEACTRAESTDSPMEGHRCNLDGTTGNGLDLEALGFEEDGVHARPISKVPPEITAPRELLNVKQLGRTVTRAQGRCRGMGGGDEGAAEVTGEDGKILAIAKGKRDGGRGKRGGGGGSSRWAEMERRVEATEKTIAVIRW